jgi:hypothetical protein
MPSTDPQSEEITLVDDTFWLQQAADMVLANSQLRTDAAKQLMTALGWLWTVYTGAAVLGAIGARAELSASVGWIIATPSFLILVAYAAAVFAFMPLSVSFDPRDPEQVRLTYSDATRRGWRRLQVALSLCGLAAASIALAIGAAVTAK